MPIIHPSGGDLHIGNNSISIPKSCFKCVYEERCSTSRSKKATTTKSYITPRDISSVQVICKLRRFLIRRDCRLEEHFSQKRRSPLFSRAKSPSSLVTDRPGHSTPKFCQVRAFDDDAGAIEAADEGLKVKSAQQR